MCLLVFTQHQNHLRMLIFFLYQPFYFILIFSLVLGMTLDSRLNWEEHINNMKAKAKRALSTMKAIAGKKMGW